MHTDPLNALAREASALLVDGAAHPEAAEARVGPVGAALEPLAARAPSVRGLVAALARVRAAKAPHERAREQLPLAALAAAAGGALAPLATRDGPLAPLPTVAPTALQLRPLTAARLDELRAALRGEYEDNQAVLEQALAQGHLPELRLLPAALDAARVTRVATFVARVLLPRFGAHAAERIAARFDPAGQTAEALRLSALVALGHPELPAVLARALRDGTPVVRLAALEGAARCATSELEPAALALHAEGHHLPSYGLVSEDSSAATRRARCLYFALARCGSEATLAALFDGLARTRAEGGFAAALALREARGRAVTERLVERLRGALAARATGPDAVRPAAVLYALAAPSHAGAAEALAPLCAHRDELVARGALEALAAQGSTAAREALVARSLAAPTAEQVHALQSQSAVLLYERLAPLFARARVETPDGLAVAEATLPRLAGALTAWDVDERWGEALAPLLAAPSLARAARKALEASGARLLRAASSTALFDALAPSAQHDAGRGAVVTLGFVAQLEPLQRDPRWCDVAAGLAAREGCPRALRARAVELLALAEDPRVEPPLLALLDDDLQRRERTPAVSFALKRYRSASLRTALVQRRAGAKPRSGAALHLDGLLDRASEPRFALAATRSWELE